MADILFEEANFEDADILILEEMTTNLTKHEGLDKLIREFHKKNKNIAAICAA